MAACVFFTNDSDTVWKEAKYLQVFWNIVYFNYWLLFFKKEEPTWM